MLLEVLEKWDLDIKKMKGLGTDGASAMTGETNGLAGRLKQIIPTLITVHCASHRLHLVAVDILKEPLFDRITGVDGTLKQLTNFINGGNNRVHNYEKAQLDAKGTSNAMPSSYDQRWLAKKDLLDSVAQWYPVILTFLQSFSVKSEKETHVPLGLAAEMGSLDFMQALCTLKVTMDCMQPLQTMFQATDFSVLEIQPLMDTLIATLNAAVENDSVVCVLQDLLSSAKGVVAPKRFTSEQKAATRNYAARHIKATIQHLRTRFPSLGMLQQLGVIFEPKQLLRHRKDKHFFHQYGNAEYSELCALLLPMIKPDTPEHDDMLADWEHFKTKIASKLDRLATLNTSIGVCSYVLQNIAFNHKEAHCDTLVLLAHVALVIPPSTASVERVYVFFIFVELLSLMECICFCDVFNYHTKKKINKKKKKKKKNFYRDSAP
jgi:hypothetical protein